MTLSFSLPKITRRRRTIQTCTQVNPVPMQDNALADKPEPVVVPTNPYAPLERALIMGAARQQLVRGLRGLG